ncbi:hypothetical protein C8R46DRAFT_274857 [Mycena filopes]|nr:hypothetical protein C8R46DRAFT_274857 [Mycena filopes]
MSNSRTTNDAVPGGQYLQNIYPVTGANGRSLSEYSWAAASSTPVLKHCNAHAPHEPCTCDVSYTLSSARWEEHELERTSTPTRRSFGSDSTVDDFFERPSADPKVSPAQLPPLCEEADSDDELFYATRNATSDDTEYYDDEEEYDADTKPSDAPGLDLLSRTALWLSEVEGGKPWTDIPQIAEQEFTFTPPPHAPKYPLVVECPTRAPLRTPLEKLALVASDAANRLKAESHPRPSSDPAHFEDDKSLVEYLSRPGTLDSKVHKRLLAHSDVDMAGSYAKAPVPLQRLARGLAITYPHIRIDVLTPLEVPTGYFPCPFPDCTTDIPAARSPSEVHMRDAHFSTKKLLCPSCKSSLKHASMGRHVFAKHGRPGQLRCKLCEAPSVDAAAFGKHFAKCEAEYGSEERVRCAKRRRITTA